MIKKCLCLLFLLPGVVSFSQTAIYGKIENRGKYESYITQGQDTITIGDRIQILDPRTDVFTYITQGNAPAGAIIAGTHPIISKIKTFGTKKRGFKAYIGFSGYGLTVWIDYENAIRAQEITID